MQICCGFGGILGEIRENFWECSHILNKFWDFLADLGKFCITFVDFRWICKYFEWILMEFRIL